MRTVTISIMFLFIKRITFKSIFIIIFFCLYHFFKFSSIKPNSSTFRTIIYFNPIFKKYAGDFNEFAALKISLFSDINGNIKDIRIAYPSEVEIIPIKIFEEFEAAVLQSNVKLVFDKDHHVFQGTAWVGQYAIYDPEKLRNCKDEH